MTMGRCSQGEGTTGEEGSQAAGSEDRLCAKGNGVWKQGFEPRALDVSLPLENALPSGWIFRTSGSVQHTDSSHP